MADLIKEFFKRDLAESEMDKLGDLLQSSPEDVLRFEKGLEEYYLATGLPQPQLPRSLHALPKSTGWAGGGGALKLWGLLAAALAGALLWKSYYSPPHLTEPANPIVPTAPPLSVPAVSKPSLSPPSSNRAPARGDELSILVETPQASLVTVRILDGKDREVRQLFAGFVQPGRRAFKWDGLLSNSTPAPPGDYRIDVRSGSYHQTKKVRIKP